MKNLQHLEQAAEKCAADLLNLKNAIEALKAKEAAPVWPMSVQDLPGKPSHKLCNDGIWGNFQIEVSHSDENSFPTIEAANSAAAFSKLSRLVHHINGGDVYEGGEVFDGDGNNWYVIEYKNSTLRPEYWSATHLLPACLYFKNSEDRDRSMIDHRDLWIQYFTGKKA